jgi:hypothetical protein
MADAVAISAAVEGIVDEAVVRTLIIFSGATPGPVYGRRGKPFLQQRIRGYNAAAQHAPWMMLVDLDSDHECPPPLRASWLAEPAPYLCFRVAVLAVEAWLLAPSLRGNFAVGEGPSLSKLHENPETCLETCLIVDRLLDPVAQIG